MQQQKTDIISNVIRARRTEKVLAKGDPVDLSHVEIEELNLVVINSIADAGFAPFHFDRNQAGIAEPWRFHVIWNEQCRVLADKIPDWFSDIRPGNKLPAMLRACGALVLVNWIPQFEPHESEEKKLQINEEHLAATAAAIQNMLLVLTAAGLGNYWSSGGFFRTRTMFEKLGIDDQEKLLGAIFVDYGAGPDQIEVIGGKQFHKRSDARKWMRVIDVE